MFYSDVSILFHTEIILSICNSNLIDLVIFTTNSVLFSFCMQIILFEIKNGCVS